VSDGTIAFIDNDGKTTAIGKAPGQLFSSRFAATVAGETVYASSVGSPPATYAISAGSDQLISFMGQFVTGLSAWPGGVANDALLAWGTYTSTGESSTANIYVSRLDGSEVRAVVTETQSAVLPSLMPLRWSADGKTLFYSSEPTGLGGYILFDGFSSLYKLDMETGVTTTLVPRDSLHMICLDDLNQPLTLLTDHCGERAIHVLDLTTSVSSTITPPAVVTDATALGNAMISPDDTRVAFALGRNNPDDEQMWLAVSNGLNGEANLVFTSPQGTHANIAGWLDANTIVFQMTSVTGGSNTIWAVNADGSNARQLVEGNILTIAHAPRSPQPAPTGGLTWQQEGSACQIATLSQANLQYGPCAGTLTNADYAEDWVTGTFMHFVQSFAPFSAKTVAGTVTFTGTGTIVAAPAEQRMIAEFARLAVSEASAGRGSAAGETALTWHREGGFAGFCDDVTVSIYGAVSATTCHAKTSTPLGTHWLTASQAEQLYAWIDTLKPFQITHDKPTQPDELVITAIFYGNGTTEASNTDRQTITDYGQLLRTLITQP
jgi:Tol biopolymer transport system component